MATRKELLCSLMSKGVIIENPQFENEELEHLNDEVDLMLSEPCGGCACGCCEEEEEELEVVDVAEADLIGLVRGKGEVLHVLYPGEEKYPLIGEWTERLNLEYEDVEMQYSDDLDAFIFFKGDFEEAEKIAEELMDEREEALANLN